MSRHVSIAPADAFARRWRTDDERLASTTEPIVAVIDDEVPFADLVIVANVAGNRAHVTNAHEYLGQMIGDQGGTTFAWCGASLGDRADVYALAPRQGVPACRNCIRGVTAGSLGTERDAILTAFSLVAPDDHESEDA